jgi:hypothetical protein
MLSKSPKTSGVSTTSEVLPLKKGTTMRLSGGWGWKAVLLAGAVVPVLGTAGCGGVSKATVTGKVSYNGKVLKGGYVTFIHANRTVSGQINQDGTYTIEDIPTGAVKICVATSHLSTKNRTGPASYAPPKGAEAAGGDYTPPDRGAAARRYTEIPAKYEKEGTSDLTYTVEGGQTTYDIKLK